MGICKMNGMETMSDAMYSGEDLDDIMDGSFSKIDEKIEKAVTHPLHYGGDTPYECIKVLKAWLKPDQYKGFLIGNVIKYLCRSGKKDNILQEAKKAQFYLDKYVEQLEQEEESINC